MQNNICTFFFIVLFQCSTTQLFSSFSVEYSSTPTEVTLVLRNSRPLSVQSIFGRLSLKILLRAAATSTPVLLFNGTIHPYFENTSITVSKYFIPPLNLTTFLFLKCFITGLCSSSASLSVHFAFLFSLFLPLAPSFLKPCDPTQTWL